MEYAAGSFRLAEYVHMLFNRHEIDTANGAPSESFHPGEQGMGWMDKAVREETIAIS